MSSRSGDKRDPYRRPKTAIGFTRSKSGSGTREPVQPPPRRTSTPAINQQSHPRRRSSDERDKESSGRGKKKEKEKAMPIVDEEEEDEEGGGVSLNRNDTWLPPDGYDYVPPDIDVRSPNDFTLEQSKAYWEWDEEAGRWKHVDALTGRVQWGPRLT